jgi:carboxymethylenebutenolidase
MSDQRENNSKQPAISQQMLDLYNDYAHGGMNRRQFLDRLRGFAVGGVTLAALTSALMPRYAEAEQIAAGDERILGEDIVYPSPLGAGEMGGYLVRPRGLAGPLPGIVVIHENRGLNPYIRDVARRAALAGYIVLAPDALYPLGGYPGDDDSGRALQSQRDREQMVEDFIAAVAVLAANPACTGNVGCVGFCFGGFVANQLAVRVPTLKAAVPFYGSGAAAEEVAAINAALLLQFAENDPRVNATWPAYQAALDAQGKTYQAHVYPGTNHGFHNDTTPRFDAEAAELAWQRTLDFFATHLS